MTQKYYHFTGEKLRNGADIPPIGAWLKHEGELDPCNSGLHASAHPFDALQYAPGMCPQPKQQSRAFTLLELLCVMAIISILGSLSAVGISKLYDRLTWKVFYIQTFHNSRIARACDGEFGDPQLEDGGYWQVLRK